MLNWTNDKLLGMIKDQWSIFGLSSNLHPWYSNGSGTLHVMTFMMNIGQDKSSRFNIELTLNLQFWYSNFSYLACLVAWMMQLVKVMTSRSRKMQKKDIYLGIIVVTFQCAWPFGHSVRLHSKSVTSIMNTWKERGT